MTTPIPNCKCLTAYRFEVLVSSAVNFFGNSHDSIFTSSASQYREGRVMDQGVGLAGVSSL